MTKTKKIITGSIVGLLSLVGLVARGAQVSFQPLYADVRFQPIDKLHAGCTNSADILFSPQGKKVTKFTLVFYYNPENIEIIRILPSAKNGIIGSKVEYNKIILEVQNPIFDSTTENTPFFQLYFKSNIVGKETLSLGTGSEVVTTDKTSPLLASFDLDFANVPECEPDIIPPSISLVYPTDTTQRITLDQYFVFGIKDIGKGVDKKSVSIDFNGKQYTYDSESLKRNKDALTFSPDIWIPVDKKRDLRIQVSDNQMYGGANKIESVYSFKSATGMVLNKNISPLLFRRITQEAGRISASPTECGTLNALYKNTDPVSQENLSTLIQKNGCDNSMLAIPSLESGDTAVLSAEGEMLSYKKLSIFATLGWILFFITFILKMHYLVSYRKHKRINEKGIMNNE